MTLVEISSPFMARPKREELTEQFNVKLPKVLVKRLRQFCNAHKLHPTFTQVTEAALTEYMDREQHKPRK